MWISADQARIHKSRKENAEAEQVYRYYLSLFDNAGQPLGADTIEALLFIAGNCKVVGGPHHMIDLDVIAPAF